MIGRMNPYDPRTPLIGESISQWAGLEGHVKIFVHITSDSSTTNGMPSPLSSQHPSKWGITKTKDAGGFTECLHLDILKHGTTAQCKIAYFRDGIFSLKQQLAATELWVPMSMG